MPEEYGAFVSSFDSSVAADPLLSYAVVSANDDLTNLDRWYDRELVEKVDDLIIYRVNLRVR